MKKIATITILFLVNSASAELKWVKGPFWKTIYENNFSLQLNNINKEINDECSYFESLVQNSNGKLTGIDSENFKAIDSLTLPSDMLNRTFQLDLQVLIPANLAVLTEMQNRNDIIALVKNEAALDILPNYTQRPSEIRLTEQSFTNSPQVNKAADSLLTLASQLFVTIKNPKFVKSGSNIFLRVNSKAMACDLLRGRASLKLAAQVQVKITLDSQISLQSVYSEIERISLDLVAKSTSHKVRAAIFGFRMGELLQRDKSLQKEQIENRMLALLEQLFDSQSMSLSPIWQDGINQKTLSVSGTSDPVDVQVEIYGKN